MKKLLASAGISLILVFGLVPAFWPLLQIGSAEAAAAIQGIPGTGTGTSSQDSTAALNSYLQSQQQKATEQKAAQQQAATNNNAQNTKLVWPWWVKLFSTAMVFNSVLAFFTLIFALAALWKWLAFKK